MATLFLIIIYMAFISLGLPDSLVGTAWPVMQVEYQMPFEAAGLVSIMVAGGTIISSLFSSGVIKRLGTGKVTFISCVMTAGALLGVSFSPSFYWLLVLAIPLGLGAGAVDVGLNNYVALHYKAHHMSWLHCFWGIGATIGPIIMSSFMARDGAWRSGFFTVSMIQFVLVVLLFVTLPLWDKNAKTNSHEEQRDSDLDASLESLSQENTNIKLIHIKGVKFALLTFLFYCGIEATMGLWGSSFLVNVKGLHPALAAKWVSTYYAGITIGRFLTGFFTMKMNNKILIRIGQGIILMGVVLLLLPLPAVFSLFGFILIGLGCAPIFPCMIHETPARFGKAHSQTVIGYQMAAAYIGATFLPPFFGFVAAHTTIRIFLVFILLYSVVMLLSSERINSIMKKKKSA